MQRRSLASIVPRLQRVPWRSVHAVHAVGSGYVCVERECSFASRELADAIGHAVRNQYTVREDRREEEGDE